MYKLKKEYIGQDVTCFLSNKKIIKLELATESEFEEIYKIPGNRKFIDVDKRTKEFKEVKKDVKK